jgi:hypothetical protein
MSLDPTDDIPPDDGSLFFSGCPPSISKTSQGYRHSNTELSCNPISRFIDTGSKRHLEEDGHPSHDGRKRQRIDDNYGINLTTFPGIGGDHNRSALHFDADQ